MLASVTSITRTVIKGLLNLIVARWIIKVYGSDYNGLASTANQLINMLLIAEGGFTVAANVALFSPLSNGDTAKVNGILAAVDQRFRKIGAFVFFVGTAASIVYSFIIKTQLSPVITVLTFMMLVVSTSISFFYIAKYSIIFQSEQKEYQLNIISIFVTLATNALLLLAVSRNWPMLSLRLIIMCCSIGGSIAVVFLFKRQYPNINYHVKPDFQSIKGTGDVFIQKITGVLYSSMPILFIASFVGTATASVYAVYNAVFNILKNLSYAIINAPRISLGRLISEEGQHSSHLRRVFNEYEFTIIYVVVALLSVSTVTIIPFVKLYAKDFSDINYLRWDVILLLTLVCYFECIHIPSGNLISMAGKFRVGRNIQIIACTGLVVLLIIGGLYGGLTDILRAVMVTAILLAVMEIGYVRKIYFPKSWLSFFKVLLTNTLIGVALIFAELQIHLPINSFPQFFIWAIVLLLLNSSLLLLVNYMVNRDVVMSFIRRLRGLL